jgi:hypothetical protein
MEMDFIFKPLTEIGNIPEDLFVLTGETGDLGVLFMSSTPDDLKSPLAGIP